MDPQRLVAMANQIADFFAAQRGGGVESVARHIVENWDPRMRASILAHVAAGGEGLTPLARAAIDTLAPVRTEA